MSTIEATAHGNALRVGLAADHGGYRLKEALRADLQQQGRDVTDFGAGSEDPDDDFPDFVIPMARAVAEQRIDRGVAVCESGVGACIAANKVPGVRAALIHDTFSARQGVEDDDMNVICLGAYVTGTGMARDMVRTFLEARFTGAERFRRRLAKITRIETRRS